MIAILVVLSLVAVLAGADVGFVEVVGVTDAEARIGEKADAEIRIGEKAVDEAEVVDDRAAVSETPSA